MGLGSGKNLSRIPDQWSKRHRIPDPDRQQCRYVVINYLSQDCGSASLQCQSRSCFSLECGIQILLFILMRIPIGSCFSSKRCEPTTSGLQTIQGSILSVCGPARLYFEPLKLLNFDFKAFGYVSNFSLFCGSGSCFQK